MTLNAESPIEIVRCDASRLVDVALLFDAYRQFYNQPSDPAGAAAFLRERIEAGDSAIFLAMRDDQPVGFTQLYPSYSSVAMQRVWVLNDLYVAPEARRHGVGARLLDAAATFAKSTNTARLVLATAKDNADAKRLYESRGWRRDDVFDHYTKAT